MRYDVSYKRFDRKRKVPSLRYGKPCDKLLGIINEVEYKRYLYSKDLMFGMYFVDIKWIEAKKKKKWYWIALIVDFSLVNTER